MLLRGGIATTLIDAASSMISQEVGEPAWSFGEEQAPDENVLSQGRDHRTQACSAPSNGSTLLRCAGHWEQAGSPTGNQNEGLLERLA